MLDIKEIIKNPDLAKKKLQRKGVAPKKIDELLTYDQEKKEFLQKIENFKNQQNKISKIFATLQGEEKEKILLEMKNISEQKKVLEKDLVVTETNYKNLLEKLPNPPDEDAPDGEDDTQNIEIKTFGEIKKFDFEPKQHWELAENLNLLDTQRSAKVSGSRFYFLKNKLAILQRALIFWAFTEVAKSGFSPMIPPFLTKDKALYGTGYLDKKENYCINPGEDNLYLIGTSEVPMVSYFQDEILDEADMPIKFVSYSPCFRKEAGTYGKDMKGIFRVHQFEKVEMVVFCLPEETKSMHKKLLEIEENLLQKLEIPYRVVDVCCGDLGISATRKYDIEAWLPGQNKFRELTSTSICTDFQSRRLKIRIKRKNGEIVHAHTLNGTAVSSRPLIAILENFQQKDGSIKIPKVLQKLCGFEKINYTTE